MTVETDKPVYKPGDKIRIRILTLDFDLKPQANYLSYFVYVIDSSNSRVNQWEDLISENGLLNIYLNFYSKKKRAKFIKN